MLFVNCAMVMNVGIKDMSGESLSKASSLLQSVRDVQSSNGNIKTKMLAKTATPAGYCGGRNLETTKDTESTIQLLHYSHSICSSFEFLYNFLQGLGHR